MGSKTARGRGKARCKTVPAPIFGIDSPAGAKFCAERREAGSAHLLWIRLCAKDLTVGKSLDFKGKTVAAQKSGKRGKWGQFPVLEDCAMQSLPAPMLCMEFVDKIVSKRFDCAQDP